MVLSDIFFKTSSSYFGVRVQSISDTENPSFFNHDHEMQILSEKHPTDNEMNDAHLAWIGAKYIRSNSFSFFRNGVSVAQCGGQTNREDSASFAAYRAKSFGQSLEGSIGGTDSFLFDHHSIDILREYKVAGIVHPTRKGLTTGSLKPDEEILRKVNEYDMIMIRPVLIESGKEKTWRIFKHL